MTLDLSPLTRALGQLTRGLNRAEQSPADEELRDAVIQRFEYSFELCWKMLKRHLELVVPDPGSIDLLSYRDLMRVAAERGLIGAIDPWIEYRAPRNATSHAYDEQRARSVYQTARGFLPDAAALLLELEKRNVD